MTTSIRNQRLSATLMLLVATAIAIPALWLASGATLAQSEQTSKASRHCVKSLSNSNKQTACYENFTAAISAATGGRITDAPADAGAAMKDQRFLEKLRPTGEKKTETIPRASGERVISILFEDTDFEGSTLIFHANRDCARGDSGLDFALPYVGDEWNDEGESIKTFALCRARLFKHRDFFGGANTLFGEDRRDFGDGLANEVSALDWT